MPDAGPNQGRAPPPAVSRRPILKQLHSAPLIPTLKKSRRTSDSRKSIGHEPSQIDDPQSPLRTPTNISPTTPRAGTFADSTSRPGSRSNANDGEPATHMDTLPDVNLLILGAAGVGKTTFVQNALELAAPPSSHIVAKNINIEGRPCVVRLIELPIEDVEIKEDNAITWPSTVDGARIPRVDGVLTLYDISDKASFEDVPETLNAVDKALLPSVLVSCKCDLEAPQRQLDPRDIEQRAKTVLRKINTVQVSVANKGIQKQTVILMIRAVCASKDPAAAARRRTMSSTALLAMNRTPTRPTHARASSEYSLVMRTDDRHDSSIGGELSNKTESAGQENMHTSFLIDESQESASSFSDSACTSASEEDLSRPDIGPDIVSDARGYTFDNLVDRLLLLPKSKADSKFRAIFLALYRKFAAPGQLLEAIVYRFEALESNNVAFMSRTVSQLRYLSVIEQWIGTYPGDFAHPRTRRRMCTFVAKLANTRIFAAAAREMSADLDVVAYDDDTDWACCDKDRESSQNTIPDTGWPSRSSTLLDDPSLEFTDNLGSLSLNSGRSPSDACPAGSLPSSYGLLHTVDLARRQAQSLTPVPKTPINKIHWRTFYELPNDAIARELTRIDWIMFSAIQPRDLIRHVTLGSSQKAACKSLVHVNRMIDHFNHLRDWVANVVLLRDKAKHRVLMLEKLMQIARRLRDLNNYNSLGAFLAGMSSTAVHRLNATRDLLPPDLQKDWMKLEILMSPTRSYSAYRLAWENSSGERIPFLPLPLRDLVGAQEGNRTFIGDEADGRVNWLMFEVMGEVIVGIQKAQGLPYRSLMAGPKQDELRSLVLNLSLIKDDEALYERSVQLEPSNTGERRGLRDMFKRTTTMMG